MRHELNKYRIHLCGGNLYKQLKTALQWKLLTHHDEKSVGDFDFVEVDAKNVFGHKNHSKSFFSKGFLFKRRRFQTTLFLHVVFRSFSKFDFFRFELRLTRSSTDLVPLVSDPSLTKKIRKKIPSVANRLRNKFFKYSDEFFGRELKSSHCEKKSDAEFYDLPISQTHLFMINPSSTVQIIISVFKTHVATGLVVGRISGGSSISHLII